MVLIISHIKCHVLWLLNLWIVLLFVLCVVPHLLSTDKFGFIVICHVLLNIKSSVVHVNFVVLVFFL